MRTVVVGHETSLCLEPRCAWQRGLVGVPASLGGRLEPTEPSPNLLDHIRGDFALPNRCNPSIIHANDCRRLSARAQSALEDNVDVIWKLFHNLIGAAGWRIARTVCAGHGKCSTGTVAEGEGDGMIGNPDANRLVGSDDLRRQISPGGQDHRERSRPELPQQRQDTFTGVWRHQIELFERGDQYWQRLGGLTPLDLVDAIKRVRVLQGGSQTKDGVGWECDDTSMLNGVNRILQRAWRFE